ncbi:MAG: hypothetical protein ACOYEV_12185 [Candidatus Nanopelagicales bacterium]
MLNAWIEGGFWQAAEALLASHAHLLGSPELASSLEILKFLHLDDPAVSGLAELAAQTALHGAEAVAADLASASRMRSLLQAWIDTATWEDSFAFLAAHQAELDTADVRAVLRAAGDEVAGQHLAILDLANVLPPETVRAIVTNPETAHTPRHRGA